MSSRGRPKTRAGVDEESPLLRGTTYLEATRMFRERISEDEDEEDEGAGCDSEVCEDGFQVVFQGVTLAVNLPLIAQLFKHSLACPRQFL